MESFGYAMEQSGHENAMEEWVNHNLSVNGTVNPDAERSFLNLEGNVTAPLGSMDHPIQIVNQDTMDPCHSQLSQTSSMCHKKLIDDEKFHKMKDLVSDLYKTLTQASNSAEFTMDPSLVNRDTLREKLVMANAANCEMLEMLSGKIRSNEMVATDLITNCWRAIVELRNGLDESRRTIETIQSQSHELHHEIEVKNDPIK